MSALFLRGARSAAVMWALLLITGPVASCGEAYSERGAIFQDPEFNFQFIRTTGYSVSGGADINECLVTAGRIKDGEAESWYREWNMTASRLEARADSFLAQGHRLSAREAYLRASNYYRNAGFYLDMDREDPRIIPTWRRSRDCFLKAADLSEGLIQPLRIPFENTTLPGYLCLVDGSGKRRPLLIVHTGFDGTGEELYFEVARAANERGYNALIFEGPGQGEMIRVQRIPFRYNWETVVTPVVDFAWNLSVVDLDRIALMGVSFGGHLAPRAAAYEHRIRACIANGGLYDFNQSVMSKMPPGVYEMLGDENASRELDQAILSEMNRSLETGWAIGHGMYVFGAETPSEYFRMLEPYTLRDVAPMIRCSTLVVDSEKDTFTPGQARPLYDALTCPKEFIQFASDEGAGLHCQMGAIMISNERIFNWLDDVMA